MAWPLARLFDRQSRPSRTRRFDAAAGGRRTFDLRTFGKVNAEIGAAGATVAGRAAHLRANNPYVSHAVANWVGALIGTGIRSTSKHPDAETRRTMGRRFERWADDADADGRTDFWGLQALIAQSLIVAGEAFALILHTDDGLRLRVISAEQVDRALTRNLSDGSIVQGVEFDAAGRRIAYHIMPTRETDQFASWAPAVRVPADDVLHIMRPLAPGQVRGISWLAPIILPASELDKLLDSLQMGVAVAAMHAGFLVDMNGGATGSPYEGERSGTTLESGLEPGALKWLPPGVDIRFNTPAVAQQTAELVRQMLRMLAAGLGLPSHLLDGDLTGANYSSLRAGLLPFRQRVEQIQYGTLVPQFLRPVWRRWAAVESLSGRLNVDPTSDDLAVEWIMPRPMQVDPEKDVAALRGALGIGIMSRRQAVAEQGWNVEDLDAEIAADRQRESALGLQFLAQAGAK